MKKILLLLSILLAMSLLASCNDEENFIKVTAEGTVSLEPDTTSIRFEVETKNDLAIVAAQENASIMDTIHKALIAKGIEKESIITSDYSMRQDSTYNQSKQETIYDGYEVSTSVVITIYDTTSAGDIIDTLISAGATRINNVGFYAKNTEGVDKEARNIAVEKALAKANEFAQAADKTIGSVISITETESRIDGPGFSSGTALYSFMEIPKTSLLPGKTNIRTTVDVVVELK